MNDRQKAMTGAAMIAMERQRQIDVEGFDAKHDDDHGNNELITAARCYLASADADDDNAPQWPWRHGLASIESFDKRAKHSRSKQLVIAGALIAAEIDRLRRTDAKFEDANDSLGTALPVEIERCQEMLGDYPAASLDGSLLRERIRHALKAMIEQDLPEMIMAFLSLKAHR